MDTLGDAIAYYRQRLLAWYADSFPTRELRSVDNETLRYIADIYGPTRLVDEFVTEIRAISKAFSEDDAMDADAYAQALDDDMGTEEGQVWGIPPETRQHEVSDDESDLDKWRDLDGLFKISPVKNPHHTKKFGHTRYRYDVEMASLPCILSPEASIAAMPRILQEILALCMKDFNPTDYIQISLSCLTLDQGGIHLSVRKLEDYSISALMQKIELLNSQLKLVVDGSFRIDISRTVIPQGGGRPKNIYTKRDRKRWAKSLVTISVPDNLCLPAALCLGKFRLTHDISVRTGKDFYKWQKLREIARQKFQPTRMARQVVVECGLVVGKEVGLGRGTEASD
jgi:hypothetical protein